MAYAPRGQIQVVDPSTVRLQGYATITCVPFSYYDPFQAKSRKLVFVPGAFSRWLAARGGAPLPIHWSHRTESFQIGETTLIAEDDQGLRFEGNAIATNEAIDALTVMAGRRRTGASLYLDWSEPRKDRSGLEHIEQVNDVFEIGPTPIGANPAAYTVMVERTAGAESIPEPAAASIATDAAMAATIYRAAARLRRI
jgi:HK97 family phage prohead protease